MERPRLFPDEPQGITLKEFNSRIRDAVNNDERLKNCWVKAETSDLSVRRNGHCYLELVQKSENGNIEARLGAVIWSSDYRLLAKKFKDGCGVELTTGIGVLVKVSANYHEAYGIKVVISDIDPTYSEGDMARKRREILERLKREGLIDLNKRLPWEPVVQRIAVISAPGAAGYGDFMNQLQSNGAGIRFYTCLFPSLMQGERTRESVLAQMRRVYTKKDLFDCLVIIRGGGSSSDLNCFDDYELARAIAMFPLPVIVGIGHERDTTVLDDVASLRVKTPTAAAEWIIARAGDFMTRLTTLTTTLQALASEKVAGGREHLTYLTTTVTAGASSRLSNAKLRLEGQIATIAPAVHSLMAAEKTRTGYIINLVNNEVKRVLAMENIKLESYESRLDILSPRNVLNRGFAIARDSEHRYITDIDDVHQGQHITIHLRDGRFRAQVTDVKSNH